MREHGLLNRLLLIYEALADQMDRRIGVDHTIVYNTAKIIREFIEDHHEKTEERAVFPILRKHGIHIDIIDELIAQHKLGRYITSIILLLTKHKTPANKQQQLIDNIRCFVQMYRYHETREDTVIFQSAKQYINAEQLEEEGEDAEFNSVLNTVIDIEKKLGIFDLTKVTNQIKNKLTPYGSVS